MTKDLIEVPDFNPDSLFYLIEVVEYRYFLDIIGYTEHGYNGKYKREKYGYVPRKYRTSYEPAIHQSAARYFKEQIEYWTKFIFKTKRNDPLEPLWKIQSKYPKLLYKKFILERHEQFPPKSPIDKSNRDYPRDYPGPEAYYEVKYFEIRESLLTYLKNKVRKDDMELINKLQELFVNKSTHLSWDEFTERKGKFLLELDLSNYIDELNKQTNKKIKIK